MSRAIKNDTLLSKRKMIFFSACQLFYDELKKFLQANYFDQEIYKMEAQTYKDL